MLKQFLLNLLYPPQCPLCRTSVRQQGEWCPACVSVYIQPRQLQLPKTMKGLGACYSLMSYTGPVRRMLHQLKYDGKTSYSAACQYGLRHFAWQDILPQLDIVVPVPLSPAKEKARGFNQTDLIFKPWATTYWPWVQPLERVRETAAQWQLSKEKRAQNLHRAFAVKEGYTVMGKRVLLVDDIFTTGATLDNCAIALREKGAAAVTGLVLASDALSMRLLS